MGGPVAVDGTGMGGPRRVLGVCSVVSFLRFVCEAL